MDVFGLALKDQFNNTDKDILWLHNSYGEKEEMPLDVFFRSINEMPELETFALSLCEGKILDVGAGAGSHSLILQSAGYDTTALEISETACRIMRERNVLKVIYQDFFQHKAEKYDTLLFLMNGIGLTGCYENLDSFLNHCAALLKPGGQILFDSSDISYLYQDIPLPEQHYFGDIKYSYEYKNIQGEWFNWLYIDKKTMANALKNRGWKFSIVYEDGYDQYLGRIELI
ncbi:MAG: methyltransferase domain-containing protein [Pyrinomonadaceae bacterium]|nr:methyltransferase domain-containing protein [Sphingobacteriaceae bacterium]